MKKILLILITICTAFASQAQTADTAVSVTLSYISPYVTSVTYTCVKTSGPASGTIGNPTLSTNSQGQQVATFTTKGLAVGNYVFTMTAKDNAGNVSQPKTQSVTVLMPTVNPPIINAGPDIIITGH
jgi:hypothetical protein